MAKYMDSIVVEANFQEMKVGDIIRYKLSEGIIFSVITKIENPNAWHGITVYAVISSCDYDLHLGVNTLLRSHWKYLDLEIIK